jgi:hypothetical protein
LAVSLDGGPGCIRSGYCNSWFPRFLSPFTTSSTREDTAANAQRLAECPEHIYALTLGSIALRFLVASIGVNIGTYSPALGIDYHCRRV